jgi:hypothetical protein
VTLFALLHGGMHDGSSWDLVTPHLRSRGFDVVTPDLPVDDENAGAAQWAQVAVDAIDGLVGSDDGDVIVVGHSIAALCVPVVAALRQLRAMVFVAGLIPVPGRSFVEHLAENPGVVTFPAPGSTGEGPFGLDFEVVRAGFYHDVDEEVAREAFGRLRRQAFAVLTERCPIAQWPDVPARFIVMSDDRAVDPAWSRRMALGHPRGGLIEMAGGHSPFLAQPHHLGITLAGLAASV